MNKLKQKRMNGTKDDSNRSTISEATPVQIGLGLGILGVVIGIVWGAATMSAKLDVVIAKITTVEANYATTRQDLDALRLWRAEIDRSGSRALDEFRKEFVDFKTAYQLHIAQQPNK